MSGGASKSSSKSQSQQTSQSYLDPTLEAELEGRYGQAQTFANSSSYQPITGSQISSFENPYTSSVVDTTNADLQRQSQIAQQGDTAQAVAAGAYGGDRAAVAQGLTADDYARQQALADSTLNSQGFTTALGAAQQQSEQQNQYPLLLQELLNSSLGLAGNPVLSSSQGSSSASADQYGFTYGVTPGK